MDEETIEKLLNTKEDEIVVLLGKENEFILATRADKVKQKEEKVIIRFSAIYEGIPKENIGIVEINKYAKINVLVGKNAEAYLRKYDNNAYQKLKGDKI